jgi:ribonucleoside-diphosphate reductase beta chain
MSTAEALKLKRPQELYNDWERAHWAAQDVELGRDPADWAALEAGERDLLYWVLSSLMVAEERISTQFCGLVLAQDDEEEGSYLSTQLVDEVRHMQFYARFQNEVIADPEAIAAHVARAREVLGEPFERVFDGALVEAHDLLRREPRNREAKVDFVTIYHMVIEGTLGLTASHFLLDFLRERDLLPGFADGYSRIAADEQRHIAYGTWFLREAVAEDPALGEVVRRRVVDLLPAVAESISPPSEGAWDILGVEGGALAEFGLGALNRRLALVGVPLDETAGP